MEYRKILTGSRQLSSHLTSSQQQNQHIGIPIVAIVIIVTILIVIIITFNRDKVLTEPEGRVCLPGRNYDRVEVGHPKYHIVIKSMDSILS